MTEDGDTLSLFTDTGGGLFLFADVVERMGLGRDDQVPLPAFAPGLGVPIPLGSPGGRVYVMGQRPPSAEDFDGMLGQQWFADRVWTFDYPARRLLLWTDGDPPRVSDPRHRVALGFKGDASGVRELSFPRLRVEIDGDTLDLLFDTGATVRLTGDALAELDGGAAVRATSFITESVMRRWRARNPGWRVIEDADESVPGSALIEVPWISVAGYRVGPVWFTARPVTNFADYMSQFMDRSVEGALGGSALKYFRITVDYPGATAFFERPES